MHGGGGLRNGKDEVCLCRPARWSVQRADWVSKIAVWFDEWMATHLLGVGPLHDEVVAIGWLIPEPLTNLTLMDLRDKTVNGNQRISAHKEAIVPQISQVVQYIKNCPARKVPVLRFKDKQWRMFQEDSLGASKDRKLVTLNIHFDHGYSSWATAKVIIQPHGLDFDLSAGRAGPNGVFQRRFRRIASSRHVQDHRPGSLGGGFLFDGDIPQIARRDHLPKVTSKIRLWFKCDNMSVSDGTAHPVKVTAFVRAHIDDSFTRPSRMEQGRDLLPLVSEPGLEVSINEPRFHYGRDRVSAAVLWLLT